MKRSAIIATVVALIVIVGGVLLLYKAAPATAPAPSPTGTAVTSPTPTPAAGTNASPTPSPAASGTTTEVTASGFSSSPIKVTSGQSLTFVNKSGAGIQVESDPHPVHTDNPELNVGQIASGASKSVTLIRKGTFGIHNHLDSSQRGTVIVE